MESATEEGVQDKEIERKEVRKEKGTIRTYRFR